MIMTRGFPLPFPLDVTMLGGAVAATAMVLPGKTGLTTPQLFLEIIWCCRKRIKLVWVIFMVLKANIRTASHLQAIAARSSYSDQPCRCKCISQSTSVSRVDELIFEEESLPYLGSTTGSCISYWPAALWMLGQSNLCNKQQLQIEILDDWLKTSDKAQKQ